MLSQLELKMRQVEKENTELIRENASLTDTVRTLTNIIDEQYQLLCRYMTMDEMEGFAPLFQSMLDVTQGMEGDDVG